jgi:uncharacterized protein (TIGR02147 family)
MEDFDNYIDFLQAQLIKRIKLNSHYSQRAFAGALGLSPGTLSEIMSGKRKLTYKNALKIAGKLGLSKIDTKNFVLLLDDTKDEKVKRKDHKDLQLSNDMFSIISNWYCFAILNLADCEGFKWGFSWLSKRLGISMIEAKDAIEKMKRVGLIKETEKGLQAVEDFVLSPDGISSQAVRDYHHSLLQKAQEALENQDVREREISGISFAMNPKDLDKIKKDIDDFQRELIDKYCKGKRSEVYHLELALFKLTK